MSAQRHPLQRHDLVWLTADGWQRIGTAPWDEQALQILAHWQTKDLPVVVARQREGVVDGHLCLGLPAPWQWERRRLALQVGAADIARVGAFPLLSDVVAEPAVNDARVYGSYGWQALTGLAYVHADSDLDVLVVADNVSQAQQVSQCLRAWTAPRRVDGEVVLPGGHAVAWRELWKATQAMSVKATGVVSAIPQVLVKHRLSARLMTMEALNAACNQT